MRKKYDAHVHIIPPEMLHATDPRFHITREPFGRVKTSSGYMLQLLPAYFEASSFSADALIATMDVHGVEKAAVMQALCFTMNEAVAEAVKKYPDRLAGAMVVEPVPGWEETMRHWYARGLRILKFEMSAGMGFCSPKAYPDFRFDDPVVSDMLALAQTLGITVTVDPSRIGGQGYQPEALYEAAVRMPELHLVICHLGYPATPIEDGPEKARWEQMLELARLCNVWFDVSAMPALFKADAYPYTDAVAAVANFIRTYGAKKAIWGTDIPGTLLNATYAQMVQMFEDSTQFSEEEKECLFRRNAQDAYRM